MSTPVLHERIEKSLRSARRNVKYNYFVDYVKEKAKHKAVKIKVLDYGCGRGLLIRLLQEQGIECYGVENFISKDIFEDKLYLDGRITKLSEDNMVPFASEMFDIVLSNQVFEHVQDKKTAFSETKRVLKKDGVMLHHFPTTGILIEPHVQAPIFHWFRKSPTLQYYLLFLMRLLGFGIKKNQHSIKDWVKHHHKVMTSGYVHYENFKFYEELFNSTYNVEFKEIDYLLYWAHFKKHTLLRKLISLRPLQPLFKSATRWLAFYAIELRLK